ncbi:L-histidine N(alpha)-methyltransferase [Candidatus Pacearchaeota archaeon]|nr:L-histidine N(alpha)-methyltransferase [Candidatus Pacearchaeota archaeon]
MPKQTEKKQAINDLIFKELIKRGYSLEGRTRVWNIADSKLWYLTSDQAQAFLDLEKDKGYREEIIQKELGLINTNIDDILETIGIKAMNVVDLGCGDGKKAMIVLQHLKGKVSIRYCPIDISGYMVQKALETFKQTNIGEVVEFKWNISDFENIENIAHLLRIGDFKQNLYLLLGNTLGNFEINELLYEVRSGMKEGDYLLIGNGLSTKNTDQLLESYTTPQVDNFLGHIPAQLGLDKAEVSFGTRFKNSRIELFYALNRDKLVKFQDKEVLFNKGDRIIVSVSYHYQKEDFISFLKMYFNDVKFYVSKDNSYALALCKK